MGSIISKSVARIFEVFELFGEEQRPLRAIEVQRRLGYPQPSTLALLKNLVELGQLSFDRIHKTYFPTMNFAQLGKWIEPALVGDEQFAHAVDDISQRLEKTVCIAHQNHLDVEIVYMRENAQTRHLAERVHTPLCASNIGQVILSLQSDDDIMATIHACNEREKSHRSGTYHIPAHIMSAIETARAQGYLTAYDQLEPNIGVVALPIQDKQSGADLCLAVLGNSIDICREENKIIRIMMEYIHQPNTSVENALPKTGTTFGL